MPQTKELQTALEAAHNAGQLIRAAYDRFQAIADAPAGEAWIHVRPPSTVRSTTPS